MSLGPGLKRLGMTSIIPTLVWFGLVRPRHESTLLSTHMWCTLVLIQCGIQLCIQLVQHVIKGKALPGLHHLHGPP